MSEYALEHMDFTQSCSQSFEFSIIKRKTLRIKRLDYDFTSSSYIEPESYFSESDESWSVKEDISLLNANLSEKMGDNKLSLEASKKLHHLLFESKKSEFHKEFIKKSIEKFPNPFDPMKLDIDL